MNCPKCSSYKSGVTRTTRLLNSIVRTRRCISCGHLFETEEKSTASYERVELRKESLVNIPISKKVNLSIKKTKARTK